MHSLRPDQVEQIRELIRDQQIILAVKAYREATGASLLEAKQAVEDMERDGYSTPVKAGGHPMLDEQIKSLLAKRKKIEAVKLYREECGVGLKEAKDAVDQIQVSMRSGTSSNESYESVIGDDPFAEDESGNRRKLTLLLAGIALVLCGLAVFFLMMKGF